MSYIDDGLAMAGLDGNQFTNGDKVSVRGPCFICGGHKRMVVFVDKQFPSWWLRCDLCGIEGWLDSFFPSVKSGIVISPTECNTVLTKNIDLKIEKLREDKYYQTLHDNMDNNNRSWWIKQGIPYDWQDFWVLGYLPEKHIYDNGVFHKRSAYSIPKFNLDNELTNIDYRIIDPPLSTGKYRSENGVPSTAFISRPDLSLDGTVVLVEGSKKAMVTSVYLGGTQVIGIPGCMSWAGTVEMLKGKEVVVVLDPDAEIAAEKLANAIGAVRVTIPTKIDDGFLLGALTAEKFWKMVSKNGRQCS